MMLYYYWWELERAAFHHDVDHGRRPGPEWTDYAVGVAVMWLWGLGRGCCGLVAVVAAAESSSWCCRFGGVCWVRWGFYSDLTNSWTGMI